MKTLITTLGLAATFAFAPVAGQLWAQDDTAPAPAPAQGDPGVSFQTFYDQLANQGTWIQSDQYGYVFQPNESDANWRPYTYGHWVNTDAGMTWVSDDSFGWATDHYGRWVNLAGTGWVWVPGYTWAPAWVSWRQDADDVGWAPLPPDSDVGIDYYGDGVDVGLGGIFGFHIGSDCDTAYGIGPGCYNFCPVAYIGDREAWRHFHNRDDNFALINHTRNVTNINFRRDGAGRFDRVRAEGPSVAALNARAHSHIETAHLADVNQRGEAGLRGKTLGVYAPRVDRNTVRTARPAEVSGRIAHAEVNRGTDIRRPLAVNSRVAPAAATSEQIHAATVAQSHESRSARIATTTTHFTRATTQPLTAMRTESRTATNPQRDQRFNKGATTTSNESRFTGESATSHSAVEPSNGSRLANEPATRHETRTTGESAFTGGEPTHTAPAARHSPAFVTGEANHAASVYHPDAQTYRPAASEPAFRSNEPVYHPQASTQAVRQSEPAYHPQANGQIFHQREPVYHPQASAPTFHPSTPTYHPQASAQPFHQGASAYHPQASAPMFHPSAPAYHPQASFHPAAPQPHFNGGGGAHASAPASHAAPAAHAGPAAHAAAGPGARK